MVKGLIATALVVFGFTLAARAHTVPMPAPLPHEVMQILLPDFSIFTAGTQNEIKIYANVLVPNYSRAELSVVNLRDFPGATFDSSTSTFSWAPTASTGQSEQYFLEPRRLQVRLLALPDHSSDPIMGTTKVVLIFIRNP